MILWLTCVLKIVGVSDHKRLEQLVKAHQELQSNLSKRSSEDQAFDVLHLLISPPFPCSQLRVQSARELTAVTWGYELAAALQQCDGFLADDSHARFTSKAERAKYMAFATMLKTAVRELWSDASSDVFDIGYVAG